MAKSSEKPSNKTGRGALTAGFCIDIMFLCLALLPDVIDVLTSGFYWGPPWSFILIHQSGPLWLLVVVVPTLLERHFPERFVFRRLIWLRRFVLLFIGIFALLGLVNVVGWFSGNPPPAVFPPNIGPTQVLYIGISQVAKLVLCVGYYRFLGDLKTKGSPKKAQKKSG